MTLVRVLQRLEMFECHDTGPWSEFHYPMGRASVKSTAFSSGPPTDRTPEHVHKPVNLLLVTSRHPPHFSNSWAQRRSLQNVNSPGQRNKLTTGLRECYSIPVSAMEMNGGGSDEVGESVTLHFGASPETLAPLGLAPPHPPHQRTGARHGRRVDFLGIPVSSFSSP